MSVHGVPCRGKVLEAHQLQAEVQQCEASTMSGFGRVMHRALTLHSTAVATERKREEGTSLWSLVLLLLYRRQ